MSGKLVLVTGVTGFIAGHVANQLLEAGYRVRGTTRGSKVKVLTETVKVPGLEFIGIEDVATSDLSEALKDVYAIVHVASPLPGRTSVDDTLNTAIDGSVNVLKAATKAGIKKVVVTSSFGALMHPSLRPGFAGLTIDYKSWSDTTREDAKAHSDDHLYVYFASKAVAEKAVWDYAAEHTELDVATVLPAFVYGPYADHFPLPSSSGLGTNGYVYMLIKGGMPPTPPPFVVDVRDVAKAHVLALSVEPKPLGEKRYIASAGNLSWHDAAVAVKKAHPEVATAPLDTFPDLPGPPSTLDNKHTTEQLNFGTWITPEQTMIDTTEGFAVVEKSWA